MLAFPVTGSSATHIAVMNEREPKMLRKSLFTASIMLAGHIVFFISVMKEKFGESGEQGRRSPVAGAICDPEQNPAIFHAQPP